MELNFDLLVWFVVIILLLFVAYDIQLFVRQIDAETREAFLLWLLIIILMLLISVSR